MTGVDISPHMIGLARENLAEKNCEFHIGGVEVLPSLPGQGVDIVVATNVLGYLSDEEETLFFQESERILRPEGWILLMVGNELFDLFALNSGTSAFFEKEFSVSNASRLLTEGTRTRFGNAKRHNPLKMSKVLENHGFSHVQTAYSQWHKIPPVLAELDSRLEPGEARLEARDHDIDPNDLLPEDLWRAMFQCSMFGVLFRKS